MTTPCRRRSLALVLLLAACGSETAPAPPSGPAAGAPPAGATLSARVVEGRCQGLGAGTTAQPGATLQTAPTERAKLALSDGSTAVLDHESRLVLEPSGRRVRLEAGSVLLDVAHREGASPLVVQLGRTEGRVEVIGTKLSIRGEAARSIVDVSRGEVRLACPRGELVVRAGEQGVMQNGEAPKVAAAPDLGTAMAWSEPAGSDQEAGIGSLRARRVAVTSGAEQELRLAELRVQARISGPIARTEIEQTFSNDTPHELEGTYRFPLPAGARIASLALEVDGQWREGRFVDRSTGERIWRGVQKNARLGGRLGRVDTDDILFAPGPWRDPALLAWEAGNRFSIRIFPIRPRSSRKVRLSYVETLPRIAGERRYSYPLPQGQWASLGRSVADRVAIDVRVSGHDRDRPVRVSGAALRETREADGALRLQADAQRFVPAGNIVVSLADPARGPVSTAQFRDGADLFGVFAIRPELPRAQDARPLEQVLVLDSSYGSLGEVWRRQVLVAQALVAEMGPEDRVTVVTCDVGCQPVGPPSQVPSAALAAALGETLARIDPGGTSDVVRAVTEAAATFASAPSDRRRGIVYIGDGVATVGVRDAARIAELAARAVATSSAPISTIAVGTTSDARLLASLAGRTGGVAVEHAPGDDATKLALRLLGRMRGAVLQGITVELPAGATEIAPAALGAIHAGEEVWVAAKLAQTGAAELRLRGTVDGAPFELRAPVSIEEGTSAGNAFVPAMWAERRAHDLAAAGDQNREQVVALASRYGLVTAFTSLLVLDSDALAERLGLGTAAPPVSWSGDEEADLDSHGAGPGPALASRSAGGGSALDALVEAARDPSPAQGPPGLGIAGAGRGGGGTGEGTLGLGGTGMLGQVGGGGSTSGLGHGFGHLAGRSGQVPQVRVGGADVRGALDRDVVRRVVQRHINEVRFCYERELTRNPALAGALRLQFVIGPTGSVQSSSIGSSTIGNGQVEACVATAARRWTFPQPEGGGVVMVVFPFTFAMQQQSFVGVGPVVGGWGGLRALAQRVATVSLARRGVTAGLAGATQAVLGEVAALRAKIAAEPDRRRHHRDLARLFARIGEIDEGDRIVRGWLSRDPMDPEGLTLLADLYARHGERDRAVRALASVVEVQPGDKAAHERMARLYERAGRLDDACPHRVTLAALAPSDEAAAAAATRCGTTGEAPASDDVRGELVAIATFEGGVDVDLALVMRDGTRVSWMGGKRNVRAASVPSLSTEKLALGFLPVGTHTLEVVRASGRTGPVVQGTVELRALGERHRVPFRLEAERATIATVSVQQSFGGMGRGFGLQ